MEVIKLGSKGDTVKSLQKALGLTADGVFGKATEEAVKTLQKRHNLVADGIVGPKTWALVEKPITEATVVAPKGSIGHGVEYLPIDVHITKYAGRKPKYIVIHYTAGSRSTGDAARNTRKVFLARKASADFIVDDEHMIQVNPDCTNYFCWAVGDAMYGDKKRTILNKDCISIEVCSTLKNGVPAAHSNHDGWSFSEAAEAKALELTKILMKVFGIDKDHVIRHFDVTGKLCPGIPGWNTAMLYDPNTGKSTGKRNTEEKWLAFKAKL